VAQGFAVFKADQKVGPILIHASPGVGEISHSEMMAIFSASTRLQESFAGVHLWGRTWAIYVAPPWVYSILLSPEELVASFEEPMRKAIHQANLEEEVPSEQWEAIYERVINQLREEAVADLLSSKGVAEFLHKLLEEGLEALNPRFDFDVGAFYPEADRLTGTSSKDTNTFLEKLTLAGIFASEVAGGVIHCPTCHGFKVAARFACPRCGSTALEVGRIPTDISLHDAWDSTSTHERSRSYYSCLSCNTTSGEARIILVCVECGSRFSPTEAEYRPLRRLVLIPSTTRALLERTEKT